MDRHVEFVTQLSLLVSLYADESGDRVAAKAALRAARAAARHGAVSMFVDGAAVRAGTHAISDGALPQLALLRDALVSVGVTSVEVARHATQGEVKALARLLARVVTGEVTAGDFADEWQTHTWDDVLLQHAAPSTDADAGSTEADAGSTDADAGSTEADAGSTEADAGLAVADAEPARDAGTVPGDAEATARDEEEAAAPEVTSGPLAVLLPPAAAALPSAEHRQLFERLISSSEPDTLRRFIEPVQLAVEQGAREGRPEESLALLLALLDCEELTDDPEMRRQFVVAVRRMTKATLLRALAMLHADLPALGDDVERALRRFGEDGPEAVIDRIACAPSAASRARYIELLRRLPTARDALVEMLDDDADAVVERAVELSVLLKYSNAERMLGDQLSHPAPRVRRSVARGLAAFGDSAFAFDALLRALGDSAVDVRLAAAVALQSRRDTRLAAALVQRFDVEPESEVQFAIIEGLGRLGGVEGVQKLVALATADARRLRKPDAVALRLAAIEALGEARTSQSMVTLQKLLEDGDRDVRETAARLYTRARRQTTAGSAAAIDAGDELAPR